MKMKKVLSIFLSVVMIIGSMAIVSAEGTTVAKIGSKDYTDFSVALNEAVEGNEIDICADVESIPVITTAITLDGNGKKVTAKASEHQFGVIDGTVTLKNLIFENGTEAIRTDYGNYGDKSDDYEKLDLVIEGCTFNNLTNYAVMGGQAGVKLLKSLTVRNCVFNAAQDGKLNNYMVWAQNVGTLVVENCTFNGNGVTKGAIHTGDGANTATVATISGGAINGVARGVQVGNSAENSSVSIENVTFNGVNANSADSKAGAIYIHNNANSNVSVSAKDNTAENCAVLVYNDGNTTEGDNLSEIIKTFEGNTLDDVVTDMENNKVDKVEYVAKVGDVTYTTLAKAVEEAADGATVTLLCDAEGEGIKIRKNLTIDFGGCTYTVNSNAVGSTGTETLAFQILAGSNATPYDVTFKNGAIEVVDEPLAGKEILVVIMNYSNLTLTDMVVDGRGNPEYDFCTIATNNGTLTLNGNTSVYEPDVEGVWAAVDCDGTQEYYGAANLVINTTGTIGGGVMIYGNEAATEIKSGTFTGDITVYDEAKDAVTITGGSFTSDVKEFVAIGSSVTINGESYTNGPVKTINNIDDLKAFRDAVNGGYTYKNETVTLNCDIDLNNEEWTPIGNDTYSFQGHFDGGNHTIKNLKITMPDAWKVGFFGMTTEGSVKNVIFENAAVVGAGEVAVVAGTPYTSKYANITLTGHITVDAKYYAGGVGGKNAYADWSGITIDADNTSYVKADSIENGTQYRTYVGGVVGFIGEGSHKFTNIKSNIDVFGTVCDVGGITGIAHYNNTFENCIATGDVKIEGYKDEGDNLEMGGIAGVWHNENGTKVTFINCQFTGTLTSINIDGVLYEGEYANNGLVGKQYSSSGTGELVIINFEWMTSTDAGFYMVSETEKAGMMRFLFAADISDEILESGIKYINTSDISAAVNATGVQGTESAFFGDVTGIPEGTEGTYLAIAYVKTAQGTYWSDVVECSPDFTKHFTEYTAQ